MCVLSLNKMGTYSHILIALHLHLERANHRPILEESHLQSGQTLTWSSVLKQSGQDKEQKDTSWKQSRMIPDRGLIENLRRCLKCTIDPTPSLSRSQQVWLIWVKQKNTDAAYQQNESEFSYFGLNWTSWMLIVWCCYLRPEQSLQRQHCSNIPHISSHVIKLHYYMSVYTLTESVFLVFRPWWHSRLPGIQRTGLRSCRLQKLKTTKYKIIASSAVSQKYLQKMAKNYLPLDAIQITLKKKGCPW